MCLSLPLTMFWQGTILDSKHFGNKHDYWRIIRGGAS